MTDVELLHAALCGGEPEWTKLHDLCRDHGIAERLAKMLEKNASADDDHAHAWVCVLEEMHPGLKVTLRR